MGDAAGQLSDGFEFLGLVQRGFGLGQRLCAFLHPLFQVGVQLGIRCQTFTDLGIGAHAFDMGPGALGDFPQQGQVVG